MHQCLSIPEIFTYICLDLEYKDLLSTALACRGFKQIALQVLWQDLPDLSPIVQLLPRNVWTRKRKKEIPIPGCADVIVDTYTLTRKLSSKDWKNVLPYLPVIRSIDSQYQVLHKSRFSGALFRGIITSAPTAVLFPNLRTFNFPADEDCTSGALDFVKFVLGHGGLEHLCFRSAGKSAMQSKTALMRSIPILTPGLKTLDMGHRSIYIPEISEAICQCHSWETLKIPSLSEAALIHVSQLPSLRKLAMSDMSAVNIATFPPISGPAFPALMGLDVRNSHPCFHASILAVISSPKYEDYIGQFTVPAKAEEWKEVFSQLAQMPSAPKTISFEWEDKPDNPHDSAYLITPDIFRPMLSLKNITMLSLGLVLTFDFDDAFVLELAKACPQITFFILGTDWSSGRRSRATMMSFVHLLRHCPNMGCIGLVVDASRIDHELLDSAKNLEHLAKADLDFTFSVGDSYIEDPVAVASFLATIVDPECEDTIDINTPNDCPFDIREKWETVEIILSRVVSANSLDGSGDEGNWTDVSDT